MEQLAWLQSNSVWGPLSTDTFLGCVLLEANPRVALTPQLQNHWTSEPTRLWEVVLCLLGHHFSSVGLLFAYFSQIPTLDSSHGQHKDKALDRDDDCRRRPNCQASAPLVGSPARQSEVNKLLIGLMQWETKHSSDWPLRWGAGHRESGLFGLEWKTNGSAAALLSKARPAQQHLEESAGCLGDPVACLVTASSRNVATGYPGPPVPRSRFWCPSVFGCAAAIQAAVSVACPELFLWCGRRGPRAGEVGLGGPGIG